MRQAGPLARMMRTWAVHSSGLKASAFLPFACPLQTELSPFTKPPVTRLRIVIEEHFKCRCAVTWCVSHHWKEQERCKEEASIKMPVVRGGKTIWKLETEWRIKRQESEASLAGQKETRHVCGTLKSWDHAHGCRFLWVTPVSSHCH